MGTTSFTPKNIIPHLWGLELNDKNDSTTGEFRVEILENEWFVTPSKERDFKVGSFFTIIKSVTRVIMNSIKIYQIKKSLSSAGIKKFVDRPFLIQQLRNHFQADLMEKAYKNCSAKNYSPTSYNKDFDANCPMTGNRLTSDNMVKVNLGSALMNKNQWNKDEFLWVIMSTEGLSRLLLNRERSYRISSDLLPVKAVYIEIDPKQLTTEDIAGLDCDGKMESNELFIDFMTNKALPRRHR